MRIRKSDHFRVVAIVPAGHKKRWTRRLERSGAFKRNFCKVVPSNLSDEDLGRKIKKGYKYVWVLNKCDDLKRVQSVAALNGIPQGFVNAVTL